MEELINNIMQSPENTNPNVLRGQLQKIGGGSGGGVMVVNCTMDAEHQIVAGKTAGEIFEAVGSGLVVVFNFTYGQAATYMYCFSADNMDGYHFCVAVTEGDGHFRIVSFNAETSSDNPTYGDK